jgi:serine protease
VTAVYNPKNHRIALWTRAILSLSGFLFSLFLQGCSPAQIDTDPADSPSLKQPSVPNTPAQTDLEMDNFNGIIILKFVEGTDIRLRDGKLISMTSGAVAELDQIFARFPLAEIARLFTQPEEEIAKEQAEMETQTGENIPDLNLYFRLIVQDKADGEALIDALNSLSIVELAYPEPIAAPPPKQP